MKLSQYPPLIADLHTHTLASGHAYGTVTENARAAAEAGLSILGYAEHGPRLPGACDPIYFMNLRVIPRELFGVRLLFGSEVNILGDGTVDLEPLFLGKLDFAIAGIHALCYEDAGRTKNTENVISCMKLEKVKMISHPDDNHTPLDYPALVQGAKEYGVALEVNNSSFGKPDQRLGCVENYRTMLSLCRAYQVPVVLNSDAHFPTAVGRLDAAAALAAEEDFPPELILNNDREKVLRFLGAD